MEKKKFDYKRLLYHIFFWFMIITIPSLVYGFIGNSFFNMFASALFTLPIDMSATYFTIWFLIPYYLLKNKYFKFFMLFFVSAICFTLLERIINFYLVYPIFYPKSNYVRLFFNYSLFSLLLNIYSTVTLASTIKLLKIWYKNQKIQSELEKEKLSAELALLRMQINPHFLFNTLNNIDVLIYKNPDKASNSIGKLSEILRYMLYESNIDKVPLEKEIEYLQNYVNLLRLRLKHNDFINFEVNGQLHNKVIVPMLFVPFIENAYKHCNKLVENPGIDIKFAINSNKIFFSVENYIRQIEQEDFDQYKGIGLNNVKRRLELLYPNNYDLTIKTENNKYIVKLQLLI